MKAIEETESVPFTAQKIAATVQRGSNDDGDRGNVIRPEVGVL